MLKTSWSYDIRLRLNYLYHLLSLLEGLSLVNWAEIHQALLPQFYLLVEFFIGKLPIENQDRRDLKLVNLDPGLSKLYHQLSFLVTDFLKIPSHSP